MVKFSLFLVLLYIAAIFGEIRCIYQFCTSDFKPTYKRELIYGIGAFTGAGVIIGYINIADNPETPATK